MVIFAADAGSGASSAATFGDCDGEWRVFFVVVSVEVECSLCLALPGLGLVWGLGLGLSVWGSSATARVVCWISRCDAGCEWVRAGLC